MDSGIIPAIISFFLPGIGQAVTTGRPTVKWIIIFIIVVIIESLITTVLGMTYGSIIDFIIDIIFAYDAYANKIQF